MTRPVEPSADRAPGHDGASAQVQCHGDDVEVVTVDGDAARSRQGARLIADAVVRAGIPSARLPDIELAVHEALVNAVRHGHLGDPTIPVEVAVVRGDTAVSVHVRDRALGGAHQPAEELQAGSGGSCALDGTRRPPPALDLPEPVGHGYGWTLITGCCDEVVWQQVAVGQDGGAGVAATEVVLTWRR